MGVNTQAEINTLAEKLSGEIVGGRLVAVVHGKKQYLTNIASDGTAVLNEVGLAVSNELSLAEAAAPRRGRRKAEVADAAPEQSELED